MKYSAGTSLKTMIKLMSVISLMLAPVIINFHGFV